MTITSTFKNTDGHYCRESIPYKHTLEIQYEDDEVEESVDITDLPPGLSYANKTISGLVEDFDNWHEQRNYVRKYLQDYDDDFIPFSDCYEEIEVRPDELKPLTMKYLKSLTKVHYAGVNYYDGGCKAYTLDGGNLYKEIKIIVEYSKTSDDGSSKKERTEEIVKFPLEIYWTPRKFVIDYGRTNKLLAKGEEVNSSEYLDFVRDEYGINLR